MQIFGFSKVVPPNGGIFVYCYLGVVICLVISLFDIGIQVICVFLVAKPGPRGQATG